MARSPEFTFEWQQNEAESGEGYELEAPAVSSFSISA